MPNYGAVSYHYNPKNRQKQWCGVQFPIFYPPPKIKNVTLNVTLNS